MLNRRSVLVAASSAAAAMTSQTVYAQAASPAAAPAAAGPFTLPPLPYATDALDVAIDRQTMELHHDKHHAAYVANLNAAAKEAPQIADVPLEKLLAELNSVPESVRTTVRNNGGGHANHSMFWQVIGPSGGAPEGELQEAIARDFGGLDKLQSGFDAAGAKVFGSGWVFVTVGKNGRLALEPRPNQDTPLMEGRRVLFGNDVWEHAYYLRYQNRRPDYLKAWWKTVNWSKLGERYMQARQGTLAI